MGFGYDKAFSNGNERIEVGSGGTLKKYNGTGTSWPTHSATQGNGVSHRDQSKTPYGNTHPQADHTMYGQGINNIYK